jgi:flagellar L-ring protein precursor FlgH
MLPMTRSPAALAALLALAACSSTPVGRPPEFTSPAPSPETRAMLAPTPRAPEPPPAQLTRASASASLWAAGGPGALLGDDRAMARGDLLTVVIAIDDRAAISNRTARSREGSQEMSVGALLGLPESVGLPGGAGWSPAVEFGGGSQFAGDGSVRRSESIALRVAATVTDVLPNGLLAIAGSQEVRVNNELRELLVTGYVRPSDISRRNEVSYDRIAQARIAYGGRGQITDMQQPRWGDQALDAALPF